MDRGNDAEARLEHLDVSRSLVQHYHPPDAKDNSTLNHGAATRLNGLSVDRSSRGSIQGVWAMKTFVFLKNEYFWATPAAT